MVRKNHQRGTVLFALKVYKSRNVGTLFRTLKRQRDDFEPRETSVGLLIHRH